MFLQIRKFGEIRSRNHKRIAKPPIITRNSRLELVTTVLNYQVDRVQLSVRFSDSSPVHPTPVHSENLRVGTQKYQNGVD